MSADENVNKNLLVIQPRWGSMPIEKDVFESTISFEESEEYMDEIHSFLLERETHAFEVEEISKELDIPPDEAESCLVRLLRGNLVRYKKPYWIVVQKKTHS